MVHSIIIDSTLKLLEEAGGVDQCPHNGCVAGGVEGKIKSILLIVQTRCPVLAD